MLNTTVDSIGETLFDFVSTHGAPEHLTFDGFPSQTGHHTKFQKGIRKYNIDAYILSPRQPNKNPVEGSICEVKRCFYIIMHCLKALQRL